MQQNNPPDIYEKGILSSSPSMYHRSRFEILHLKIFALLDSGKNKLCTETLQHNKEFKTTKQWEECEADGFLRPVCLITLSVWIDLKCVNVFR